MVPDPGEAKYRKFLSSGFGIATLLGITAGLSAAAYVLSFQRDRDLLLARRLAIGATQEVNPASVPENPDYVNNRKEFDNLFFVLRDTAKFPDLSNKYPVYFIQEPSRNWKLSYFDEGIKTAYFSPTLTGYDPHALAGAFIKMSDGIKIKAERERTVIWTQKPDGLETLAKDVDMSDEDAKKQVQDVRDLLYEIVNTK